MPERICDHCHQTIINGRSNQLRHKECEKKRNRRRLFHPGQDDLVVSQTELAKAWGVTPQAIQLIEARAIEKFRRRFAKMCPDTVPLFHDDIRSGRW